MGVGILPLRPARLPHSLPGILLCVWSLGRRGALPLADGVRGVGPFGLGSLGPRGLAPQSSG